MRHAEDKVDYLDALLEAAVAEHVEALGDHSVLFLVLAHRTLDHLHPQPDNQPCAGQKGVPQGGRFKRRELCT